MEDYEKILGEKYEEIAELDAEIVDLKREIKIKDAKIEDFKGVISTLAQQLDQLDD